MTKDEVKALLIQMLKEIEYRYVRAVEDEVYGHPSLASNALWKAEAIIVDIANDCGIIIDEEEYADEGRL